MQCHPGLLKLVTEQELVCQFTGESVKVMHHDGLHQPLLYQVPQNFELGMMQGRAGVIVHKDGLCWHSLPVGRGPGMPQLRWQGIPSICLIRRADTRIARRGLTLNYMRWVPCRPPFLPPGVGPQSALQRHVPRHAAPGLYPYPLWGACIALALAHVPASMATLARE